MNRWCDGFARYGGDEAKMLNGSSSQAWAEVETGSASLWNLSSVNPRTGDWHLRLGDLGATNAKVRRVFGAPLTEVLFGQALYFERLPTVEPSPGSVQAGFFLAEFRTQANDLMVSVYLGTDGAVAVYRNGHSTGGTFQGILLGRSLPVIGAGAYQHFEHYLKVDNTTGAYELRVDEVTVLNLTGIDTDNAGGSGMSGPGGEISQVTVGRWEASFGGIGKLTDMADCYVNDTTADGSGCDTFVGDVKSGCRMVDADTAQADFAKSSGIVGYSLINERPPVDAGYISTGAAIAESDFGFENGPANISEILTVRPFVRAMKDDAGTCTVAPNMKSSGTKGTVADQPIATAFAYYDSNVPFDPHTGVPWLATNLDAALEVVERIS
jgi:hypothetical protein